MSTYTTKLTYKIGKGINITASSSATGTGSFNCDYDNHLVLYAVNSVSCTRNWKYQTASNTATKTLPVFDSITSVTYAVSGAALTTLNMYNAAGTAVSLTATGGTMTSSQIAVLTAIGSGGNLKLYAAKQLKAQGPAITGSPISGWSPQSYTDRNAFEGDYRYKSVSKSASATTYDSFNATITITVTYEYSSPEPPPGPTPPEPPEPGEFDYKNYTLVVEPGGVAIGNEVDGTKEKQKFLNCIETKFANAKTDIHADKMYTCKDGWTEVDLNTANVTTGQSTVGRQIGVAYRKEANGRVTVVGNVKFTSSASSINICTLPDEVKPTNVQYAFFNMSTINNDIGLVYISKAGNVNISWTRMNNSDSAITTTWPYCDFTFTYFV